MTSSGKQTDRGGGSPGAVAKGRPDLAIAGGVVLAGWILILYVNRWHVSAPVVFLLGAWLSILLFGKYLWSAGVAMAREGAEPDDAGFGAGESSARSDLIRQKRTFLKAIKEVEFDRQMGKMSESDAQEITRAYRSRAIEIIKRLEALGDDADGEGSVQDKIERELRARIAVMKMAGRASEAAKRATAAADKSDSAEPAAPTDGDATGDSEQEEAT